MILEDAISRETLRDHSGLTGMAEVTIYYFSEIGARIQSCHFNIFDLNPDPDQWPISKQLEEKWTKFRYENGVAENLVMYVVIRDPEMNVLKWRFLEDCKEYGLCHPAKKISLDWVDCIPEKVKKVNSQLIDKMQQYMEQNDCFSGVDNYPIFFYNGKKRYKNNDGDIVEEKTSEIAFDEPCLFLQIITDDARAALLDKALEEMGFYIISYTCEQFYIATTRDQEYEDLMMEFRRAAGVYICQEVDYHTSKPDILKRICRIWRHLSKITGPYGKPVNGGFIELGYDGQKYRLYHSSPYQSGDSWRPHVSYIEACLKAIGAEDIKFIPGRAD